MICVEADLVDSKPDTYNCMKVYFNSFKRTKLKLIRARNYVGQETLSFVLSMKKPGRQKNLYFKLGKQKVFVDLFDFIRRNFQNENIEAREVLRIDNDKRSVFQIDIRMTKINY